MESVQLFGSIRHTYPVMAQAVLDFQWFVDGIDPPNDREALRFLATLATFQPTLSRHLLHLPWLADDVTRVEMDFLKRL